MEKGKYDEMGNLIEATSINLLLQKQLDFMGELTLLQYHASQIGVLIDCTPKCHPEIAGDGIEYACSLAKLLYWNSPLSLKCTKDKFRALVDGCLSTNNLDIIHICKCSRRAREYMQLYQAYEKVQLDDRRNGSSSTSNSFSKRSRVGTDDRNCYLGGAFNYELIEKAIQTYKCHQNVQDFDVKFIQKLNIDPVKVEFLKKVVNKMKSSF
jgi:hypothetical protein